MKFVGFVLFVMLSFSFSAQAQQETHGGDGFAVEFFKVYTDLRAQMPSEGVLLTNGQTFLVSALDQVRPQLKVISAPQIFWNGQEVSARNTPSKYLVELSQTHWVRLNYEQKISLVLHEVLPIAGWIDSDYAVSTEVLKHVEIQRAKMSVKNIVDGLLSCNTAVLQSMSAGFYQSLVPNVRTDLLYISLLSSCEFYVRKAVEWSSLKEVQTTCDGESGETPFEAMVSAVVSAPSTTSQNLVGIFDLLYARPEDRVLSCKSGDVVKSRGTVCDVLKKSQDSSLPLLKVFAAKASCE